MLTFWKVIDRLIAALFRLIRLLLVRRLPWVVLERGFLDRTSSFWKSQMGRIARRGLWNLWLRSYLFFIFPHCFCWGCSCAHGFGWFVRISCITMLFRDCWPYLDNKIKFEFYLIFKYESWINSNLIKIELIGSFWFVFGRVEVGNSWLWWFESYEITLNIPKYLLRLLLQMKAKTM